MPTINPPQGSGSTPTAPTFTYGGFGMTQTAQTLTTGAGTNTKGAFASFTLGTATQDIEEIILRINGSTAIRPVLLDIEVAGVTVVTDLFVYMPTTFATTLRVPIKVLNGQQVRIRAATSAASVTFAVSCICVAASVSRGITTINPINTIGTTCTTAGTAVLTNSSTWIQLGTALVADTKGLILSTHLYNDSTRTAESVAIEIGTGATAGSAVSAFGTILSGSSATAMSDDTIPTFLQTFPAGTIFWGRAVGATGADSIGLCLYRLD